MTAAALDTQPLNAGLLGDDERRHRLAMFGLSVPAMLLVALVLLVPFSWLAWLSLFDASGALSAENYARLLRPAYVNSFVSTLEVAALVTGVCILLGYPVAYLLSQLPKRAAQILLVFVILPFWTSVLVRTYAWLVLLQREGIINTWLKQLGLISESLPLVNNLTGTVIGMVHVMLPFLILPLYASMRAIDPVYLRAAANCGASPAQAFRQVFLPLSAPGLGAGAALTFVLCLGFYLTPALLGGGRVAMWSTQIADAVAKFANWGAASALSVALLVVTGLILWLMKWGVRRLGTSLGER
ncbi:ABC transporter permease [Mesorhizobium sp. CU2]|uniref:ABC transporter permease n=1 Tax=unclassified Mesorhizobium TaxID=325217 RepID=UPI00112C7C54|nr:MULTISPECIES: ABC transporter permease [unclassified Mesorhizobium]TPN85619.1 ABC transporter permease [Mesorhizobium sp. CU3]TPO10297.1 ABC transporter permease [Mesorhizobium sp. CU2]